MYNIGIDIGSTTVKLALVDEAGRLLHHSYERHNARIMETLSCSLAGARGIIGNEPVALRFTGSVGQGIAEQFGLPFVQEVVGISIYARRACPDVHTLIDIGGEDAKMVFFRESRMPDLRMNGNCAGGTGAFIDQMALLLHIPAAELSRLALQASHVYPIASRCGVFSKTDIQNLLSKNASKADVAASILHAIAVQTITTLSHGMTLQAPILLCGGPFTFLPALRKAFADYLQIAESGFILPGNSHLLPAIGAAWSNHEGDRPLTIDTFIKQLQTSPVSLPTNTLSPIFAGESEYREWAASKSRHTLPVGQLHSGDIHAFLGIDSGSTTTKIILMEATTGQILFTHYCPNDGNPIQAVRSGLEALQARCAEAGTNLFMEGSCSTGYGEELIKTAFNMDNGIVETMAHFRAAQFLNPQVSFILDIGGQDMKAVFIDRSTINRIEINEACSSGCGSFIATFARSLGHSADEFDRLACSASRPADLGTRCTVFMNSKVKEALREGLSVADIAAGLSYSVVKNCLYKVLKQQNTQDLGGHIVLQGGTMRNDSVVRAFELLTGRTVIRCDRPELMGAYGCALYAADHAARTPARLSDMLAAASYRTTKSYCKGCQNNCLIEHYTFANGRRFVSGNKCERVFSNRGGQHADGTNLCELKNRLLFDRPLPDRCRKGMRIGIPRCLNMYENYPFWHTLLVSCGLQPVLSAPSAWQPYERTAHYVMSDNICFPAKIAHSHIHDLEQQGVDRILMPYVMHEKLHKGEANSYNCPIVTGYGEVIRNVMPLSVPFDEPVISFKDTRRLIAQCTDYLAGIGVPKNTVAPAVKTALDAQARFEADMAEANRSLLDNARRSGHLVILLAGRPYHADMLVQHKLAEMIAAMGIDVITDDIVRDEPLNEARFVGQWSFPNRILKAAQWASWQDAHVQFVQMTSFGCGPDAFLLDEIKAILQQGGKALTLLKMDDINNIGSMRLRIRSLVESIRMHKDTEVIRHASVRTPVFSKADKGRKILMPFFTPFISPLLPALFSLSGYEAESLPMSDSTSVDYGLRYANNEICYPATLVVGDIIRAFKSGCYDPARTAVAFTQTGGQCRATNYLPLIKKALAESGFAEVPVISVALGSGIENDQPGFRINWFKTLPAVLHTLLFSDCLAQFYHATLPRESEKGTAQSLVDKYHRQADSLIRSGRSNSLFRLIAEAAGDFRNACTPKPCPCIGIVGEIYLKYNPFAHREITTWMAQRSIQVVPSMLTDFFTQYFVNRLARRQARLESDIVPERLYTALYRFISSLQQRADQAAAAFPYYRPFGNIFHEAEAVEPLITLNTQFGEGWLLPAEIIGYYRRDIRNVISLQPFGCIANHIVSKGLEKKLKELYPGLNLLSLDFDSGVSNANIINRLLLFCSTLAG